MTSPLESLAGTGKPLAAEPMDAAEFDGLLHSGTYDRCAQIRKRRCALQLGRDRHAGTRDQGQSHAARHNANDPLRHACEGSHHTRQSEMDMTFKLLPNESSLDPGRVPKPRRRAKWGTTMARVPNPTPPERRCDAAWQQLSPFRFLPGPNAPSSGRSPFRPRRYLHNAKC